MERRKQCCGSGSELGSVAQWCGFVSVPMCHGSTILGERYEEENDVSLGKKLLRRQRGKESSILRAEKEKLEKRKDEGKGNWV